MPDLARIPEALARARVPGWLVCDFRGGNPVLARLLGTQPHLTRRACLLLTRDAAPRLLLSRVEPAFALPPHVVVDRYVRWTELHEWLRAHVAPLGTVAMEYSPGGELPMMSWVDGGTLDLVRGLGVEVVPSADLFQMTAATWSPAALASHERAMAHAVAVRDLAFARVRDGATTEHEVQALILDQFERRGLETEGAPVVAVNAHSGDPHYDASATEIRPGDWLLLDLWCKERGADAVFADITWVAFLGDAPPDRHRAVFETVAAARDAVVAFLREHHARPEPVRGHELDRVARDVIAAAGYGEQFVHRTGHSLSPDAPVHGLGVNLDDLETHDTRPIRPGLGFTVEPGIYLPEFGVRSEINVFMGDDGPVVTSPVQHAPLCLTA